MTEILITAIAITWMTLYVVSVTVQNTKRTITRWAREVVETGRITSRETSEIGTIYSFRGWSIGIDADHRFQILRHAKIRKKLREYKMYKRLYNILWLVLIALFGFSFYLSKS